MTELQAPTGPGRTITQARGRRTYEALIAAGFKLLETHEFEDLTIAGIADAAGYSVGAFYARFKSKDEFFEAMVAQHLLQRSTTRKKLLTTVAHEELVDALVDDLVKYYWRRRRFWRAVLMRAAGDKKFFEPIHQNSVDFVRLVIERLECDANRALTEAEAENVRFAIHMVLGMVNNRIVNRPRPSFIGQSSFVANLTRAFRLVSGCDALANSPANSLN